MSEEIVDDKTKVIKRKATLEHIAFGINPDTYITNDTVLIEQSKEDINSPDRYKRNGIECIDAMLAIYTKEEVIAFCKLNAFKYLWRSNMKEPSKSIQKANWYLNKIIELETTF